MTARTDIAMGFDARYAPHAAAVVASVIRHAPGGRFRFIFVHDGIEEGLRKRVESVAPGQDFLWLQVSDDDLPEFEYGHLSRAILFRLGLEALAPRECGRILYLDSDTAVMGDVRELAAQDLKGEAIGAVQDQYVDAAEFAVRWGLPAGDARYFNSGVLVIDLERVRAERLFTKAIEFVARHGSDKLPYGDQDSLNYVLWGRWRGLDPVWNVQRFVRPHAIADGRAPALVHYIGLEKPWLPNTWHPWAWAYWENLKRTPFEADVVRAYNVRLHQLMRMRIKWWLNRPRERAL